MKENEDLTLTPVEIEHQTFESQSFGGYNTHEVDQFLRRVVKSFEKILRENADLRERIEFLSERIYGYQSLEQSMREAFLAAQNASQEFIQIKKMEAERIILEATEESNRIKEVALNEKEKIEAEILEIKGNMERIKTEEFKILVRACLEVLDERKRREEGNRNCGHA